MVLTNITKIGAKINCFSVTGAERAVLYGLSESVSRKPGLKLNWSILIEVSFRTKKRAGNGT